MTTARALILSALILAIAIVAAAISTVPKLAASNRYQLVNAGNGATVRLDRQSGSLIGCKDQACRELTRGAKIIATSPEDEWKDFDRVPDTAASTARDR